MVTVGRMAPASPLLFAVLILVGFGLIRTRRSTLRFWICCIVIWDILRGTWRSNRARFLCWCSVFYLDLIDMNCRSQPSKPFLHLQLFEGVLPKLLFSKFGHGNLEGWSIDHSCHDVVNALGLWYSFLYALLHHRLKDSTLKSLSRGSIDHWKDHRYRLLVQA